MKHKDWNLSQIVKVARDTAELDRNAKPEDRTDGFVLLHTFADFLEGQATLPGLLGGTSDDERAQRIVNAVLKELEGRGGFDVINQIKGDDGVYPEMYASLVEAAKEAVEDSSDPRKSRFHPES